MVDGGKGKLKTAYSPEYRSCFVSDGTGFLNQDRILILDLYNERQGFREEVEADVEGGALKLGDLALPNAAVREFQVRLYLSLPAASRIRDWLNRRLEEAEKGNG